MTKMGDLIAGWRLECGCIHNLLTDEAGYHESILCPLHVYAPKLLEELESAALALEEAVHVLAGRQCNLPSLASVFDGHVKKARTAIRAAKAQT